MLKRHKDLLRALVGELRRTLAGRTDSRADGRTDGSTDSPDPGGNKIRGDLDRELERLGIAENGKVTPVDALVNPTALERRANLVAAAELNRGTSREEVVERAAYTWINRLLALRAMEARGLIDETLRANPDYEGLSEALFVLRQTAPGRTTGADAGWWAVLENACAVQAEALPGLFDLSDPAAALRPSTQALLKCIRLVGGQQPGFTLAESDAAFADPDAIGWAYQFYQETKKAETYAKLGRGGKAATRAEIAAVTQLFTEPYMVQWLLQNSLGRSYHELYPASLLPAQWAYYIKPEQLDPPSAAGLATLSLLDPCVGSGHFLREAFDMFAAMYREQQPGLKAAQVADYIFERHLHGIDLDPRAVQLAALTLYLRAWELVRDERRRTRQPGPGSYRPAHLNLATTPTGLSQGSLDRHLLRHPEDRLFKPVLQGIFESLEQAEILGSLLRPGEHLDKAIAALQGTYNIPLDLDPADAALRRSLMEMAKHNPAELRRMLMERIAASFQAEAQSAADVAVSLFGRAATEGVRLLQLLDRKYAVVVTNPPYMGSSNMDEPLRKYVEKYYNSGKRDLYAAFILRCLEFCHKKGKVGMVTMQNWMFLRSFSELRAVTEADLFEANQKGKFTGLLRNTEIAALAHLGRYAFSDIDISSNPVVFVLKNTIPSINHRIWACRMTARKPSNEQAYLLSNFVKKVGNITNIYYPNQQELLTIPESPLVYWLSKKIMSLLTSPPSYFRDFVTTRYGLNTADNSRHLRFHWETFWPTKRWFHYVKAGGYRKWYGLRFFAVDWEFSGKRIASNGRSKVQNADFYFKEGLTYSLMARGALGVRVLPKEDIFDSASLSMFSLEESITPMSIAVIANCRLISYLLRVLSSDIKFNPGYVDLVPLPNQIPSNYEYFGQVCSEFKRFISLYEINEAEFSTSCYTEKQKICEIENAVTSMLLSVEGFLEEEVFALYGFNESDMEPILSETGIPSGWFPLIDKFNKLPQLPHELNLPPLNGEVEEYLINHDIINPDEKELYRIKNNLRILYEAGWGAKDSEQEGAFADGDNEENGEEVEAGAHIPIPKETFLEELSIKLQIHPISVYWLLEELRAEGVRCKPEEKRLLEDRLTVLILRLMGHRWPKQLEAGEPVPDWADQDGILTLTQGAGGPEEKTLAEQMRRRLRAEEGPLGAQQTEALLAELTGQSLEDWLRKSFFTRHLRQFKYRPIAWHLASRPGGSGKAKGGSKRPPAFECLLYYHVCSGDALARIRTQYVEPLIRAERGNLSAARQGKNDTAAALAGDRLRELEEFAEELRQVEENGFDTPELAKLLAGEPLDRWSGDGYLAPTSRDELGQQERSWRVDINDGVRVNIAPLQLAGLLAGDVLKAPDAKKALADRARWRADERRWVREGKLPRCGWLNEEVPESPAWTKLAPQRAAEQQKLEAKRRAALEKVQ